MAASVLDTARAIEASVHVVRTFVKLREVLRTHKDLARKLGELEEQIKGHDREITALFQAIRQLMEPAHRSGKQIGPPLNVFAPMWSARQVMSSC